MNQGEIVNNMRHILGQIEEQTRSSLNLDTKRIRELCTAIQQEADYLSDWAWKKEESMPMEEWKAMYYRRKAEQ